MSEEESLYRAAKEGPLVTDDECVIPFSHIGYFWEIWEFENCRRCQKWSETADGCDLHKALAMACCESACAHVSQAMITRLGGMRASDEGPRVVDVCGEFVEWDGKEDRQGGRGD